MADEADLRFARIALAAGMVAQTHIDEATRFKSDSKDPRPLGRILVQLGFLGDPVRVAISELMMQSPIVAIPAPATPAAPALVVAPPMPAPAPAPLPPATPPAAALAQAAREAEEIPAPSPTPSPIPVPMESDTRTVRNHPFGKLVLGRGWASEQQISECLEEQHKLASIGANKQLGDLMVEKNYLSVTQVRELVSAQDKEILRCEKCGARYNVSKLPPGKTVRCIKCGAGLTVPTRLSSAAVEASVTLHEGDPLIGKVLGGCRIEQKLGQGGMAAVYKGTHLGLNKVMAVKILPPASALNHEFQDRFIREARAAAKIEHANIVQVFNVGCEQDYNFILMQYVQGRPLTEILSEERCLPPDRCLEIITEVAKGLSVAHKHGIVHRDVKPDNIMVMEDGKIKISDFGLAHEVRGAKGGRTDLIAGTPYYMPPEQWDGKNVDARSDLYALGITYYFLLSGKKPFMAQDMIVLMKMHAKDEPAHPKKFKCNISDSLWSIIRKMIAKKPADRYQSADELLKDLERLRAGLDPLAMMSMGGEKIECGFCGTLNPIAARRCSVCKEGLGELGGDGEIELGLLEDEFACPACKEPNPHNSDECKSCGRAFCSQCHAALAGPQGLCKKCGGPSGPPAPGAGPGTKRVK